MIAMACVKLSVVGCVAVIYGIVVTYIILYERYKIHHKYAWKTSGAWGLIAFHTICCLLASSVIWPEIFHVDLTGFYSYVLRVLRFPVSLVSLIMEAGVLSIHGLKTRKPKLKILYYVLGLWIHEALLSNIARGVAQQIAEVEQKILDTGVSIYILQNIGELFFNNFKNEHEKTSKQRAVGDIQMDGVQQVTHGSPIQSRDAVNTARRRLKAFRNLCKKENRADVIEYLCRYCEHRWLTNMIVDRIVEENKKKNGVQAYT